MKIPKWLGYVLTFLAGVAGVLALVLRGRGSSPTKADGIVSTADEEKKRIADSIKADSDAALAERFNKLTGGKS
jgi:hypothetical protein